MVEAGCAFSKMHRLPLLLHLLLVSSSAVADQRTMMTNSNTLPSRQSMDFVTGGRLRHHDPNRGGDDISLPSTLNHPILEYLKPKYKSLDRVMDDHQWRREVTYIRELHRCNSISRPRQRITLERNTYISLINPKPLVKSGAAKIGITLYLIKNDPRCAVTIHSGPVVH